MKNKVLLNVIAVLLIVGVGISFAYFISSVNVTGEGSDVTLEPGDMIRVIYDAGNTPLSLSGVLPGGMTSKDFTVTVIPTDTEKEATYGIYLDLTNNTFVKCDDSNYNDLSNACTRDAQELIYRIKDKDSGDILATGDLTGVTGRVELLKETKTVDAQTVFNYTIEIEFVETNADQNHNTNKTLSGEIVVEFAEMTAKDIILANKNIQTRNDFSTVLSTDTNGIIYQEQTSDGTTYYFAGDTDENWVSFAGYYWRIIRINEDGSIRMIYNGTTTQVQTNTFSINSSTYNNNAYVGYMYTLNQVHGLGTNSGIKTVVDGWYEDNLLGEPEEDLLSTEAGFCGDRTPYSRSGSSGSYTYTSGGGTGTTVTYYGAYTRLYTGNAAGINPTLECPDEDNDLYTVDGSSKGNHALDYPIGLITADEVAYAGGVYNTSNSGYYLYTNQYYWTMSPSYFNGSYAYVFIVYSIGYLGNLSVNIAYGVRPVLNLKADVTLTGSGTINDPYEVS